jgi:predicted nucleotidyltransferase
MSKKMKIKEIKKKMIEIKESYSYDIEVGHQAADELLTELLILLGHQDIVDEYEKITKYYS